VSGRHVDRKARVRLQRAALHQFDRGGTRGRVGTIWASIGGPVRDALVAGLSGTAAQVEPLDGCAEPRRPPAADRRRGWLGRRVVGSHDRRRSVVASLPSRGEIRWAVAADNRWPVLVVSRGDAVEALTSIVGAPVTRIRTFRQELSSPLRTASRWTASLHSATSS
jgi:hypothetical protein